MVEAGHMQVKLSLAVLDTGAHMVAFARMDGCPVGGVVSSAL